MSLRSIQVQNFTVFAEEEVKFSKGINVILGPNGVGKTHLLKLLYAASQAADPKVSFPQKVVRCFLPDDYRIARLVKRQQGADAAKVRVSSYGRGNRRAHLYACPLTPGPADGTPMYRGKPGGNSSFPG